MKKFKILSREKLITSPYCPVERQIVELPSGGTAEWYVNTCSDAVIVVPVLKSGEILLQRTYKHGCGEVVTEFCAGMVDEGEDLFVAAERELLEETGYAGKLEKVGESFANSTGSSMKYHFFIARDCEKVADQSLDHTEQIELFTVKNMKEARLAFCKHGVHTSSANLAALAFYPEQK